MQNLIEQALIFISAAVIVVPFFQRFGFGSVLGYLIAGVLIGPFGLSLIKDPENIVHFSETGIFFLLFIIGLEIQPRKLWSMRSQLLGLGGIQILICTLIFTGIGLFFELSLAVASVIGFALSLSSTAFAVQTLIDKNVFNTEFGRGSFSILLMQDLVAIPALAIIPFLIAQSGSTMKIENMGVGLAIIGFLIFASRYLLRPIFRLIAKTRMRDVFTAFTLLIVIGVSALMQKVGLSAGLGTFIAGVLLADSEYRHELEINLEPFKGLLMGLFFISVGMSVSIDIVLDQPLRILAMSLGYILIKSVVIYLIGRFFGMNHRNSKLMGINISQGGEFAFVIFGLFTNFSVVSNQQIAFLTAVITLSMAINPLLSVIDEKLSRRLMKKTEPKYDEVEDQSPQIIIAGVGRFGQTFGRILRAQNIPFVAIDHDSDQIELLRKFGNKVVYGDAARPDLLEAAGASTAKYFILAVDDIEISMKIAKIVKSHFPNLKIFARARNRGHVFDLMELGVTSIKREVFDSSVNFVQELFIDMGYSQEKATWLIEKFKQHDEMMVIEQSKVRSDDKTFMSVSHQGTAQLAQVLSDESLQSRINPQANSSGT